MIRVKYTKSLGEVYRHEMGWDEMFDTTTMNQEPHEHAQRTTLHCPSSECFQVLIFMDRPESVSNRSPRGGCQPWAKHTLTTCTLFHACK